jgi:circadian clock protein KaiC
MSAGLKRITSGVVGLDTVLQGGFFAGGLYLIQGTPGTGKTTFANQISFHHVASGGRALYVTLLAEYHSRMMQYIGRLSFFDESAIPDRMRYLSGFSALRDQGLPGLLTLVRREIISSKASILCIDGVVAAKRITDDEQLFNEFVHELQGIALATGCTVLLVTSTIASIGSTPEHTMVDGIIEMSDQQWQWSTGRALQISKIRGTAYLRGKHTYKITDDGIVVYPRAEALEATPPPDHEGDLRRVSTGSAKFDEMLGGGLPAGSPTMLLGPSGIGKTTFGLQFLAGCTAAEPGLLFGFYEAPARIMAKAQQVCPDLVDRLRDGRVEMLWEPPGNDSLDIYAERLLAAIQRRKVQRLFLDGLGAFHRAPDAEARMRQFLPALTNQLRVLGVTTLYSLEAGNIAGPDTDSPFGDLSMLAENLILLRFVEMRARLHRVISILKVRDSDFDPRLYAYEMSGRGPRIKNTAESIGLFSDGPSRPAMSSPDQLPPPRAD